jgi:hypothetical protein
LPARVNISTGDIPANTTPVYTGNFVYGGPYGDAPLPGSALDTLTLTICDTLTGAIVNGCDAVDILNTGRGSVDDDGKLTIGLLAGDTDMSEVPGAATVLRSLIIDWTYNGGASVGRREVTFTVTALTGP